MIIKNYRFFVILILSLAFIARFIFLGKMSFWSDELDTLNCWASQTKSAGQIIYQHLTFGELVEPPLFALLLHIWLKVFGHRDAWLRTLPALISFLSLLAMWRLFGSMEGNKKVFFIYLILISFSGYYLYLGREVRTYGLLLFMAILNHYYLFKGAGCRYSLTLLAGVCVNPFMWLVFIPQVVYLWLVREKSKMIKIIKLSVPALILYIPYLLIVGRRFETSKGCPVFSYFTLRKLAGLFLHLATGFKFATNVTPENYRYLFNDIWFIPGVILAGVILLLVAKMCFEKRPRDRINLFCLVNIIVPILIVAIIYPRRLGPRSLCIIAPFYHFLVIRGMESYSRKLGYGIVIALFLFINIVSGQNLITSSFNPYIPEDWKSLVRDVEREGRYLIATNKELGLASYYSNSNRAIGYNHRQDPAESWPLLTERLGKPGSSSIAFLLREVEPYPLLYSPRRNPTSELLNNLFEAGHFESVENYGLRLKVFRFELSQNNK